MAPDPQELLAIAHITRAHGVRGEVSAVVLAPAVQNPEELIVGRTLTLRDPKGKLRKVQGEGARPHQDRWLLKFEGIDDMTAAETLREMDVCLPRAELPALPEDWYYESDLQGCHVVDERLGDLGEVTGLELGYAQPQLKLKRPGGTEILIPWRNAFFPTVDLEQKIIRAQLPVGMPGIEDDDDDQ